jgi:hypothetical protein
MKYNNGSKMVEEKYYKRLSESNLTIKDRIALYQLEKYESVSSAS